MRSAEITKPNYWMLIVLVLLVLIALIGFPSWTSSSASNPTVPIERPSKFPSGTEHTEDPAVSRISGAKLPLLMTANEVELFYTTVKGSKVYAEWGSGGSTELAPFIVTSKAYSVEHAVPWCTSMEKKGSIQIASFLGLLKFICVDTGLELSAFGNLKDMQQYEKMKPYIEYIDRIPEDHIDVVLIDGRFRSAVGLYILTSPKISQDTIVLVHDFTNRKNYHVLLNYYELVESKDTLHAFRKKASFSKESLAEDYAKYVKIQQ